MILLYKKKKDKLEPLHTCMQLLRCTFLFQNCKSVSETLKKPPSTSQYFVVNKRGPGNQWQIFLACGSNSILEASSISNRVACLIGAYYLFHFEYPQEAKGAYLFLQEYLIHDFVKHHPAKYAAALAKYQTSAMVFSNVN